MIQSAKTLQTDILVWIMNTRFQIRNTISKLRRGPFKASSYISLVIRPVLEHEKVRLAISAPIMAAVVATGATNITPNDLETALAQTQEVSIQESRTITITPPSPEEVAHKTYGMPVETLTGISQGYHVGHKGADLRAPLGTRVTSIDAGVVTEVAYDKYGYGHHVYVNHNASFQTLYAHLDQIYVKPGQQITMDTTIGTVGLTGWTTGPHLHFETYQDGIAINPLTIVH